MLQLNPLQERFLLFQVVFAKSTILVANNSLVEGALFIRVYILHTLIAIQLNQLIQLHSLTVNYGKISLVETHQKRMLV